MKFLVSLAAVFSLVLADPGFVALPFTVEKTNVTSSHSIARRSVNDKLQNAISQYFVDIELGTPSQTQHVSIDTGSSDLWVYGPESSGAPFVYDHLQSSTSQYIDDGFQIQYVDQSTASGSYYTDNSSLGGANVNFQFAVANKPFTNYGVFGIASIYSEADVDGQYPNYPVALKQQGIIESTAYSLYLNDLNAESGTLLFGGVDTSKYSGQLYSVPITDRRSFDVDFEVEGYQLNGVLDSGTSLTYLPDDIANGLVQKYNAQFDENTGLYYTDRAYDDTITYSFSGAKVTVPSSELFLRQGDRYALTILSTEYSQGYIILGDSFLRSAYVVYDLDNQQIAIAQANYHGSGSIEPITSSGIPGAQPAPGQ